jgi:predicted metal-binding membrane protein
MPTTIERVFLRDRLVIAWVLAGLTALSWLQMLLPNATPAGEDRLMPCCGTRFDVAFVMWTVMMAGMMIPSVAPMILSHAAIARRRVAIGTPLVSSALVLAGYLLVWTGFSAVAALAQCALYRGGFFDGHSLSIGPWAGGTVLLAAGVFQLSPAKNACLTHCRTPLGYFVTEWRHGHWGAVQMGARHGLYCMACCWLLMAILFAVGIMNILWGAVITAFVLAEKVLPWRRTVVWSGGLACMVAGMVLVCRAAMAM